MKILSFSLFRKKGVPAVHLMSLFLLLPVFVLGQTGGQYELSRSTIDGGGGVSIGGKYIIMDTIGQPDAGVMSGVGYELFGGFWSPSPCVTCGGDLDANGVVNLDDLNQLVGDLTMAKINTGQWLINPGDAEWRSCSDMDSDDDIDLADLNRMVGNLTWEKIMADNWYYPCGTYDP